MTLKIPKIIGHRGAAAYAPENTLEGIHTAADMGIEWVELDVKLTGDHVPVIFHDETLERTTNGAGKIAETAYEDLRQLEAGSWFSESFAGIKIPTLEEALEVLIDRGLGLNLEIKPCPGREVETAEAALDILARYWDDHDRLLISSFRHGCLETARDMAGDWARGLLLPDEWPENWREIARYLEVSSLNIDGRNCTRADVQALIDFDPDLARCAYTINDPDRANELFSWGIHAVFSDEPDTIQDALVTVH